jgi:hypothetical protein
MKTEQREEIENALEDLEDAMIMHLIPFHAEKSLSTLLKFARQQLSLNSNSPEIEGIKTGHGLRVDGEKLLRNLVDADIVPWAIAARNLDVEALVLECLTTEEKP